MRTKKILSILLVFLLLTSSFSSAITTYTINQGPDSLDTSNSNDWTESKFDTSSSTKMDMLDDSISITTVDEGTFSNFNSMYLASAEIAGELRIYKASLDIKKEMATKYDQIYIPRLYEDYVHSGGETLYPMVLAKELSGFHSSADGINQLAPKEFIPLYLSRATEGVYPSGDVITLGGDNYRIDHPNNEVLPINDTTNINISKQDTDKGTTSLYFYSLVPHVMGTEGTEHYFNDIQVPALNSDGEIVDRYLDDTHGETGLETVFTSGLGNTFDLSTSEGLGYAMIETSSAATLSSAILAEDVNRFQRNASYDLMMLLEDNTRGGYYGDYLDSSHWSSFNNYKTLNNFIYMSPEDYVYVPYEDREYHNTKLHGYRTSSEHNPSFLFDGAQFTRNNKGPTSSAFYNYNIRSKPVTVTKKSKAGTDFTFSTYQTYLDGPNSDQVDFDVAVRDRADAQYSRYAGTYRVIGYSTSFNEKYNMLAPNSKLNDIINKDSYYLDSSAGYSKIDKIIPFPWVRNKDASSLGLYTSEKQEMSLTAPILLNDPSLKTLYTGRNTQTLNSIEISKYNAQFFEERAKGYTSLKAKELINKVEYTLMQHPEALLGLLANGANSGIADSNYYLGVKSLYPTVEGTTYINGIDVNTMNSYLRDLLTLYADKLRFKDIKDQPGIEALAYPNSGQELVSQLMSDKSWRIGIAELFFSLYVVDALPTDYSHGEYTLRRNGRFHTMRVPRYTPKANLYLLNNSEFLGKNDVDFRENITFGEFTTEPSNQEHNPYMDINLNTSNTESEYSKRFGNANKDYGVLLYKIPKDLKDINLKDNWDVLEDKDLVQPGEPIYEGQEYVVRVILGYKPGEFMHDDLIDGDKGYTAQRAQNLDVKATIFAVYDETFEESDDETIPEGTEISLVSISTPLMEYGKISSLGNHVFGTRVDGGYEAANKVYTVPRHYIFQSIFKLDEEGIKYAIDGTAKFNVSDTDIGPTDPVDHTLLDPTGIISAARYTSMKNKIQTGDLHGLGFDFNIHTGANYSVDKDLQSNYYRSDDSATILKGYKTVPKDIVNRDFNKPEFSTIEEDPANFIPLEERDLIKVYRKDDIEQKNLAKPVLQTEEGESQYAPIEEGQEYTVKTYISRESMIDTITPGNTEPIANYEMVMWDQLGDDAKDPDSSFDSTLPINMNLQNYRTGNVETPMQITKVILDPNSVFYNGDYKANGFNKTEVTSAEAAEWGYLMGEAFKVGITLEYTGDISVPTEAETKDLGEYKGALSPASHENWAVVTKFRHNSDDTKIDVVNELKSNDYAKANFKIAQANLHVSSYTYPISGGDNLEARVSQDSTFTDIEIEQINEYITSSHAELPIPTGTYSFNPAKNEMGLQVLNYVVSDGAKSTSDIKVGDVDLYSERANIGVLKELNPNKPSSFMNTELVEKVQAELIGFKLDTSSTYYNDVYSGSYTSPYISKSDTAAFNFVKNSTFDKGITAIYESKIIVDKSDIMSYEGANIYSYIESLDTLNFDSSNTVTSDDFSELVLDYEMTLGYNIVNGDDAHPLNGEKITLYRQNESGVYEEASTNLGIPGETVKIRSKVGKSEVTGPMDANNFLIKEIKNFAFTQTSSQGNITYPNSTTNYLKDDTLLNIYGEDGEIEESTLVGMEISPQSEFYKAGLSNSKVRVMKDTDLALFNQLLDEELAKGVTLLFDYEHTIPSNAANHSVTTDVGIEVAGKLYQGLPDSQVDNKAKIVFNINKDSRNLRITKVNVRDENGLFVTSIQADTLSGYQSNTSLNLEIGKNYYFEPVITYDAPISDNTLETVRSDIKLEVVKFPKVGSSETGTLSADNVSGQIDYKGKLSDGDEVKYSLKSTSLNVLDYPLSEVNTSIPNISDYYIDGGDSLAIFGKEGEYDGYIYKFIIPDTYSGEDNGISRQMGDWDIARVEVNFADSVDYSLSFGDIYDQDGVVYDHETSSSYVDRAMNVNFVEPGESNEPFYIPITIEQLTSVGELDNIGIELEIYKFDGDSAGGSADPYGLDALKEPVRREVIDLGTEVLNGISDTILYDYQIPSSITESGTQLAIIGRLVHKPSGEVHFTDVIDANTDNNKDNIGISNFYNFVVSNLQVLDSFTSNVPDTGAIQLIEAESQIILEGGETSADEPVSVQVKYSLLNHPDNPPAQFETVQVSSGGASATSTVRFENIQTYPDETYNIQVEVNPILPSTGNREHFENRYLDNIQERELEVTRLTAIACVPCSGGQSPDITVGDAAYLDKIKNYPVLSDFEDNSQTTNKMTYKDYYRAVTGLDFEDTYSDRNYAGQMQRWEVENSGSVHVFNRNTVSTTVYFGHYENREIHTGTETSGHEEDRTRWVGPSDNREKVEYTVHVCDTKEHTRKVNNDARSVSTRGSGTSFEKEICVGETTKYFGPYRQEFYERLMISQARSYSYNKSSEKTINLVGNQASQYNNGGSTVFSAQKGSFVTLEFDVIYETNRKIGAIKSMSNNYYARSELAGQPGVELLDFFGSAATHGSSGFKRGAPNENNGVTENLEVFHSLPLKNQTVYWDDGRKPGDPLYSSIYNDYNRQRYDYGYSSYSWSDKAADNMWIWWGLPNSEDWYTPEDGYTDGPCTGTCSDCTDRADSQYHSQNFYSKDRLEVGSVTVGKSGSSQTATTTFNSYMEPDWKYDPDCDYVSLDKVYYNQTEFDDIFRYGGESPINAPVILYFVPKSGDWATDFGLEVGKEYSLPVSRIQKMGDNSFQKFTFALKKGQNNEGYFMSAEDVLDSPSYDPWTESDSSDTFYGTNDTISAGEEYKYQIGDEASGVYEFDVFTEQTFNGISKSDAIGSVPGLGQDCRFGLSGEISGTPPIHYEKFD